MNTEMKIGTWFRSNGPRAQKQYYKTPFYSGRCCQCEGWLQDTWLLKFETGEKRFYCDECANGSAIKQQEITRRILALNHALFIEPRISHYKGELSTSYGEWVELGKDAVIDPTECYVLPSYASGSDYSGDLVEVSNHKALLEMMPDSYTDGLEYLDYSGGYGTFGLAIRFDAVAEALIESLEGLEDYPVLDEDLHSQLEMESQNEAWESDIRSDFKKALGKALFQAWVDSPATDQKDNETDEMFDARQDAVETFLQDECGEMSDASINEIFYKMADRANVYWTNEQGESSWINVDDVVKRGLDSSRRAPVDQFEDWRTKSLAELHKLIQHAMSETKYDLHIVRYVDPNQLSF